jgi:hypothetical protein
MAKYSEAVSQAGDRVLSLIGDAQDAVVKSVSSVSQLVGSVIPDLPALPLSDAIPAPRELVDEGFSFAERVLKQQKGYATDLVKAFEPISTKVIANGKKTKKAAAKATATA